MSELRNNIKSQGPGKAIVLVHGGFVDGSGWEGVYHLLKNDGFLFLEREKFAASFAADVHPDLAAFMGDSQVAWGLGALLRAARSQTKGRTALAERKSDSKLC